MGLEKLGQDVILETVKEVMGGSPLFKDFLLDEQNVRQLRTPTILTQYDFSFFAPLYNRWVLVRIEDYFKSQKIMIYINQLLIRQPVNLDLEGYLLQELKIGGIKQKLLFKASTKEQFLNSLQNAFQFILENTDEKLREIIGGTYWLEQPFDWHQYR